MSSQKPGEKAGKNNGREKATRKDAILPRLNPEQKELWFGFLRYEKQRGVKNIESSIRHLSPLFKYVISFHTNVLDFGVTEAGEFRRYLETVKDKNKRTRYTLKTIRSYISMVKRFYHYLFLFGMIKNNPFSEVEKLRIIELREKQRKREITFNKNIPAEMEELLKEFFEESKIRQTNKRLFLYHMSKYFLFLKEHNLTVEEFRIKEVIAYRKWLKNAGTKKGRKYAGITIRGFLKNTKRFVKFLAEKGFIEKNPFTQIQRKKRYRGVDKNWVALLEDFMKMKITKTINQGLIKNRVLKLFTYLKNEKLDFKELEAEKYKSWLMKQKTKDGKKYKQESIRFFLQASTEFYNYLVEKQIVGCNTFDSLRKKQQHDTNEEWKKHKSGFAEYLKIKRRSQGTIKGHGDRIKMVFCYLAEKKLEYCHVKRGEALEFRGWLIEKGKGCGSYTKGTIRNYIATAKIYFDYLKRKKIVYANPFALLYRIREEKLLPKNILNENEMSRLLDGLRQYDERKNLHDKKTGYLCHVIAELMYSTGMRISEAACIGKEDIDFTGNVITLTKTKEKRVRKVFLNGYAKQVLQIYMEEMREFVLRGNAKERLFGYKVKSLSNMLNRELKNISKKKKLKPADSKGFRHAVGYHLLRAGCNIRYIQAILGHNSIRSTEVYTRVDKKDLKKVMDKYHPRKWTGR